MIKLNKRGLASEVVVGYIMLAATVGLFVRAENRGELDRPNFKASPITVDECSTCPKHGGIPESELLD